MTNTLLDLFETAGKNDFEFTYKTGEGENVLNLDLENKKVTLIIGDPEHKDLELTLRDAIMTIKGDS
jgi:hypothetical protein